MDDTEMAELRARKSLELALFGTTEQPIIERLLDEYCRSEVGARIESVIFHRKSVASVHGVELVDGRQVVVKVNRPVFAGRLEAVQRVQAHLARQGFPSPRPLAGPSPIGLGIGTAESLLNNGSIVDAHDPTARAVLARGLHDVVRLCAQFVGVVDPGPFRLVATNELWPPLHDLRFDFERTAAGAEWIDRLAENARDRLRAAVGRMVIGHEDWRVENLRVSNGRIVAVYDWESLALLPEPVLVGAVAHAFTASWDADFFFDIPNLDESRAFIADYQTARGGRFDAAELDTVDAGHLYALAYGARCQHSDALLKLFPDAPAEGGYVRQLRERGERWLGR
jgi:hypothetical protein